MECPICLEDVSNTHVTMECCRQKMHLECIIRWLHTNMTCPMCRAEYNGLSGTFDNQVMVIQETNKNRYLFGRIFMCSITSSLLIATLSHGLLS
jgi:hypothetical protein